MPLTTVPLPYGLRDVKLYSLVGEVPAATGVDLPNARTFAFTESEDTDELRGDDGVVSVHGKGASVQWTLEEGGISLDAVKILYGGTITDTGTTPAQKRVYSKKDTDIRPYCQIVGQAISDSGGDFVALLFRAKATGDLTGTLADGTYWLTGASGRAIPRVSDRQIYTLTQNETATVLV